MTNIGDRYLWLCVRRNRTATPSHFRASLAAAIKRLVSTSIVRRRPLRWSLHNATRHLCAAQLTYRRERLSWIHLAVHQTADQWKHVFFMDEFQFSLQSNRRRCLIWREQGTCYHPSNIHKRYSDEEGRFVFRMRYKPLYHSMYNCEYSYVSR